MVGTRDKPHIPADWISELVVTGSIPGFSIPVHARGVRIRGVILDGQLDFESTRLAVPMVLDDIEASEPIVLEQATGSWISINQSTLAGVSASQLKLDHALDLSGSATSAPTHLNGANVTGDVFLNDGFTAEGEVNLAGATIGGSLERDRGSFTNKDGHALNAQNVQVTEHVFLSAGFTAGGVVSLWGATVGGRLDCDGGPFSAP